MNAFKQVRSHKSDVISKKSVLCNIPKEKQQLEHLIQMTDEALSKSSADVLQLLRTIKSSIQDEQQKPVDVPDAMIFTAAHLHSAPHIGDYQVKYKLTM